MSGQGGSSPRTVPRPAIPSCGFAGYHHATIPGVYLALVVAAAAVTAVSAARGTRAALADSARNVLV